MDAETTRDWGLPVGQTDAKSEYPYIEDEAPPRSCSNCYLAWPVSYIAFHMVNDKPTYKELIPTGECVIESEDCPRYKWALYTHLDADGGVTFQIENTPPACECWKLRPDK